MIYLELFWSFFQIGLFSIGGGYAAMPLIQHQVVELHRLAYAGAVHRYHHHLADDARPHRHQFGHVRGHAVGRAPRRAGGHGGVCPAFLHYCADAGLDVYYRYRGLSMVQGVLAGLRPAVVAMIASAGVTLVNLSFFGADALPAGLADVDLIAVLLFAAALFVLRRWKKDPILVMAGAGAAGLVLYTLL